MKLRVDSIAFACYSKSCAPPPAGKGGSSRSGSPVRPNPLGPGAGRNPKQAMIDRTLSKVERAGRRAAMGGTAGRTNVSPPTIRKAGSALRHPDDDMRRNVVKYKQGTGKLSKMANHPMNPRNASKHPDADKAQAGGIQRVKTAPIPAYKLKAGDKVNFAGASRVVDSVGKPTKNSKTGVRIPVTFKDGGITDIGVATSLPRTSRKK